MKKRRYVDLYGYTAEEFDNLLESSANKILRANAKTMSKLDMQTVFTAYRDETRKLPRRRLREIRANVLAHPAKKILRNYLRFSERSDSTP
jgi:hypothetical protein